MLFIGEGLRGVEGGTAPRQPLPGTREAWPQGVGWLPSAKPNSAADAGNPGPSKSPYPYIDEPALCGVNNGQRARGPTRRERTVVADGGGSFEEMRVVVR